MPDYTCPNCGTGFPERVGESHVYVEPSYGDDATLTERFWKAMQRIAGGKHKLVVDCPQCEHRIVGDNSEERGERNNKCEECENLRHGGS